MLSENSSSPPRDLTAERLLMRIMKLEHRVRELHQQSIFKDQEIKRLESRIREWQQITLRLQTRVSKRP